MLAWHYRKHCLVNRKFWIYSIVNIISRLMVFITSLDTVLPHLTQAHCMTGGMKWRLTSPCLADGKFFLYVSYLSTNASNINPMWRGQMQHGIVKSMQGLGRMLPIICFKNTPMPDQYWSGKGAYFTIVFKRPRNTQVFIVYWWYYYDEYCKMYFRLNL